MPRKRGTRAKVTTPKKLQGIAVTENLTEAEREEQLRVFLKDFDVIVKNRLRTFEVEGNMTKSKIKWQLNYMVSQMSVEVQNMKIKDLVVAGGSVELGEKALEEDDRQKNRNEVLNRLGYFPATKGAPLNLILEEGSDDQAGGEQSLSTVRPKRTRKTKMAPPSSTVVRQRTSGRTARSRCITPATMNYASLYSDTPLVTPKFDVKLPITPENVREMKPGERLMSIHGSPVRVDQTPRKIAGVRVNSQDFMEVTKGLTDITGTDMTHLTPNRVERMLRLLHG